MGGFNPDNAKWFGANNGWAKALRWRHRVGYATDGQSAFMLAIANSEPPPLHLGAVGKQITLGA